ncbi:MAG: T9SS type A sorting domain-containing protein [Saprospiraceae bacterium]|nr:T9SS type A sorting domain-containing protein [Saprospiraceae bacterium]
MKKILLYLFFLTAACQLYAAAPANDVCSGAITLTPSASCNPIVGTTEGATDNNETGDCTAGTENAVWFKFVATSSNTTVLVDGDASFDAVVGVLTACGSTTRPTGGSCTDNTGNDGIEKLSLSGLTIGSTYYIQVHEYAGEIASTSDFTICIIEGLTCSGPSLGGSASISASGCPATYSVSYNVTSLGTASSYTFNNANGYTISPSVVNSVPTIVTISGIPSGSPSGNTTMIHNVNVGCNLVLSSVTGGCPPLSNECATTNLAVTPNTSTVCTTTLPGVNTSFATQSEPGCLGTADDDVWVSFVASSAFHDISIVSATNIVHQVFSGACGSQTSLNCSDPNTSSLSNLTIGNTYYMRIYSNSSGVIASNINVCITTPDCVKPAIGGSVSISTAGCPSTYSVSFNVTSLGSASSLNVSNTVGTASPVTITSVPTLVTISGIPIGTASGIITLVHNASSSCNLTIASQTSPTCPPVNDECAGAIALTPTTSCSYATYTNVGATNISTTSCQTNAQRDVWFSVVVPASGNLTISTQAGGLTDGVMTLSSGSCGSLTQLYCDDDSDVGTMPRIIATGLTPGSTVYIRILGYNNTSGTFGICATTTFSCTGPGLSGPTYNYSGCPTSYSVSYIVTALGSATSYSLTNANGYTITPSTVTSVPTTVTISGIPIGSPTGNTTLVHNGDANCNYVISSVTATSCPATNDECASAIPLTVGTSCSFTTYSNTGGTNSTNSAPTCASYAGGDVWFSAVVPASGDLVIDTQTGDILDSGMQLYSGSCGSLTAIECDDDDSGNGSMSRISRLDLTPGSTVYIRIWEYSGDVFGTFGICAYEPAPAPNCSAGNPTPADLCADAPVLNNPNGFCGTTSSTYTIGDPGDADAICGSPDNNSYLQFEAADVSLSIGWWVTGGSSCSSGVQFAIFGGSCTSPSLVAGTCINPTGGTGSSGTWNISGLTVGATYYLYIDGYAGDVCNYVFAAQAGVQLPIELTYFNGKVSNGTHYLNWATASERKNAYFEVERSFDGTQFTKIGKVISKANQGLSVQKLTYDYNDLEPADGINYYRLKQVDLDGKHSYSKVISLSSSKESNSIKNLYPNPTSSKLDLMVQVSQEDFYVIEVYDILGKRVDVQKIVLFDGINQHSYDASLLSKGYYRMMLKDDKGQILSKNSFIKN